MDTILDGLTNARRLFENGILEERKRVVRPFVDGMTVVGSKRSGELRMKKLPTPEPVGTGSSFEMVAGVRFEAQQRNSGRDPEALEVVEMAFEARGTALVPLGAPGA